MDGRGGRKERMSMVVGGPTVGLSAGGWVREAIPVTPITKKKYKIGVTGVASQKNSFLTFRRMNPAGSLSFSNSHDP